MAAALGCRETTDDSEEGGGIGVGDNGDNSHKNTVAAHSHCSKRATSPHCFTAVGRRRVSVRVNVSDIPSQRPTS